MISIISTILIYVLLYVEYMVLYPSTEQWLSATLCCLLLLATVIYNVVYQSVWVACPKMKKKRVVNSILFMNLMSMILIFIVESLWQLFKNKIYVGMVIFLFMIIHFMLVSIQQWYLSKNKIFWKKEYQFLKTVTMSIAEIKYEHFLKRYLHFTFSFGLVYLFIGYDFVSIVLIVIHLIYSIYLYNKAWEKGFMLAVIYNNEKWYFLAFLGITSLLVIIFNNYIPVVIAMIIITFPSLVLRLYLQRYMYCFINHDFLFMIDEYDDNTLNNKREVFDDAY